MTANEKKRKILFVITKSNFGGAQKYVFDLATGLPKEKFDVVVALGGAGTLVQKLHDQNIRIITIPSLGRDLNIGNDFTSFLALRSIFCDERPDVVHLNSAKAGGVGAFAARLAGVPNIIFTAHGWAFNEERSAPQCIAIKFFSWLTVFLSHHTIAVSEAVKNDTKKWPLVCKKVFLVKNGASSPVFYSQNEARTELISRTKTILPSSAFIVGTIAELHKNKGLIYAIEAFAKISPLHPTLYYFILGDGEERKHLDALVKHHNLQERVFLLGFVKDAARFLSAFNAFLLPSVKEGLPYVLLEAGFAGIPVIATNVGGISEVIENEKTGLLIPSRDPGAITEALQKLLENPVITSRLSEELHIRVTTEFSLERMLTETTALYLRS